MDTADNVKSTKEWQALNTIWKSCTPEQQTQLKKKFQLLTKCIRHTCYVPKGEYAYLNGISEEARQFVISVIDHGEINIYHSVMAIMDNKPKLNREELIEYYFKKYETKRPYLVENKPLVEEVIDLCWLRYHAKGYCLR